MSTQSEYVVNVKPGDEKVSEKRFLTALRLQFSALKRVRLGVAGHISSINGCNSRKITRQKNVYKFLVMKL